MCLALIQNVKLFCWSESLQGVSNLEPACQTAQYSGCVSKLPRSSVHSALQQSLWNESVFEMTALGHEGDSLLEYWDTFEK